jgi:hypothetical protein
MDIVVTLAICATVAVSLLGATIVSVVEAAAKKTHPEA